MLQLKQLQSIHKLMLETTYMNLSSPSRIKSKSSAHAVRHSTGFKLANEGRDTRSIQHYLVWG